MALCKIFDLSESKSSHSSSLILFQGQQLLVDGALASALSIFPPGWIRVLEHLLLEQV